MRKTLTALTIAGLALLVMAPYASASVSLTKPERQLLALVNKTRAAHHLPALKVSAKLQRAARAHSAEMIAKDYFSHNSASGETFAKRIIRFGYTQTNCTSWKAGENIAYGVSLAGTPQAIFKAWMKSKAHRTVILTRAFRQVGLGRAAGNYSGMDSTFMFTLDVGRRTY